MDERGGGLIRRSTPMRVLALGGALLLAFYTVGLAWRPGDTYLRIQSDFIYQIAPVIALLLSFTAIARSSGRARLGWIALALVLATWEWGDWTYTYYDLRYGEAPPFPGTADVAYYLGYGAFIAGIALLTFPRGKIGDRRWVVDAVIVIIVAGAVSWTYLVEPIVNESGYSSFGAVVALGYPVFDFMLFVLLVITLYVSGGRLSRRALMLVGATALLVVGDAIYTYLATTEGFDNVGNPIDPFYMASYLLMGACFLLPDEDDVQEAPRRQSIVGLMLPYAAAFILAAAVAVEYARGEASEMMMIATAITVVLIIGRQFMTLIENLSLYRVLDAESRARRSLLDKVVRAQEDERHRIALDIHDRPVQSLSFLATRIGSARKFLQRGDGERANKILSDVEVALSTEVQGLRELMMDLRPPALEERGLRQAISDLAGKLQQESGIEVVVDGALNVRPSASAESIIYRITQEALGNVYKHAGATAVRLTLGMERSGVVLRISDNGSGFEVRPVAELAAQGHYGLLGIIERAELLGGRCEWRSCPGEGTEFVASFPLDIPEAA